ISRQGRRVEIQMLRQSACSHCELNQGCGTGAIGRLLGHRSKSLVIETTFDLEPGDRVILGMPDSSFLKASLLIYGLPLFSLMLSAIAGQWLFEGSEFKVLVLASLGFAGGFSVSARLARKNFASQFDPEILEINSEPTGKI
ncbi:MAG: SoxR reducing system RseC family protein, partial [Gammaproteobacteria bacterium]|nr:SoxR reducing system RseC family protein [Gammaproteobacteria bacterium]